MTHLAYSGSAPGFGTTLISTVLSAATQGIIASLVEREIDLADHLVLTRP